MTYNIRDYQREALNQLRQGIAQGIKTQVLMMPTGSGKTVVASVIQRGAQTKGNKSFFVVDTLELIDQTVTRFFNDGLDVGVIQGDHEMTDYSKIIQVASIQTLGRRWGKLAESLKPKLLVIDECHVLHKAHIELIEWCKENNIPVIGLSATPFRKGMGKVFDRLVIGTTPKKLTEQGFLVPALCYAPNIPDLKGIKSKGVCQILLKSAPGLWCKSAPSKNDV